MVALGATLFFGIELLIGIGEELFDALAVTFVDGNADTGGEARLLRVAGHHRADTIGDALGLIELRFRKHQGELVATVARGDVDGAAMNTQNVR